MPYISISKYKQIAAFWGDISGKFPGDGGDRDS